MEGLTFKNNYYTDNVSLTGVQQRTENAENFTALDKKQIKQDVVELKNKTKETTKDSWITRVLSSFGVEDTNKFFKTVGLTILTVIGFGVLGNKMAKPTAKAGIKLDKFLLEGDNVVAKGYRAVADKFASGKTNIANWFEKREKGLIKDIYTVLKEKKLQPKNTLAQSYGSGGKGIFGLTMPDILKTSLNRTSGMDEVAQNLAKDIKANSGLLENGKRTSQEIVQAFMQQGDDAAKAALEKYGFEESKVAKYIEDLTKSKNKIDESLSKLFEGEHKEKIFNDIFVTEKYKPIGISQTIIEGIKQKHNLKTDEEMFNFLSEKFPKNAANAGEYSEFVDVVMNKGGVTASWWPVNILDKIGEKVSKAFGKEWGGFARANLGDSAIKFSAMDGTLSKTFPGRFVQKSVIFPAEYISNFVNDKSGFGVFLCASLMALYNNVQDAPKEQVKATIADDFVGTIGSVSISTPIAAGITYGIANLSQLQGKGIVKSCLRGIGKLFGAGLAENSGAVKGFLGGAFRAIAIMMIIGPKVAKPVFAVIHKIFGKPYDKNEVEAEQKKEEEKKKIIPELGITQGELAEKMEKNPEALKKLQGDDELAVKISHNPKLLLDLLDGKEIKDEPVSKEPYNPNNKSPLLEQRLNNTDNSTELFSSKKNQEKTKEEEIKDTATYIPSSEFTAREQALSEEKSKEFNEAMLNADKAIQRAQKYI